QPRQNVEEISIRRLLQSASVFLQAEEDSNKTLAQDLAFFSAIASEDKHNKALANDVFYSLGNLPGADRLSKDLDIKTDSFNVFLRQSLLKALNTVSINKHAHALPSSILRLRPAICNGGRPQGLAASQPSNQAGKSRNQTDIRPSQTEIFMRYIQATK